MTAEVIPFRQAGDPAPGARFVRRGDVIHDRELGRMLAPDDVVAELNALNAVFASTKRLLNALSAARAAGLTLRPSDPE